MPLYLSLMEGRSQQPCNLGVQSHLPPHLLFRPLPSQVSLYLMLMEDRYQQPCNLGVLWNINDGASMEPVGRVHAEVAALMMHRWAGVGGLGS